MPGQSPLPRGTAPAGYFHSFLPTARALPPSSLLSCFPAVLNTTLLWQELGEEWKENDLWPLEQLQIQSCCLVTFSLALSALEFIFSPRLQHRVWEHLLLPAVTSPCEELGGLNPGRDGFTQQRVQLDGAGYFGLLCGFVGGD